MITTKKYEDFKMGVTDQVSKIEKNKPPSRDLKKGKTGKNQQNKICILNMLRLIFISC